MSYIVLTSTTDTNNRYCARDTLQYDNGSHCDNGNHCVQSTVNLVIFPFTNVSTFYFNFLSRFSVVPDNGTISVASPLDFELKQNYSLELEAKDGGNIFTRLPVMIIIANANDNMPEFVLASVNFNLNELVESETVLGQIMVSSCKSLLCFLSLFALLDCYFFLSLSFL